MENQQKDDKKIMATRKKTGAVGDKEEDYEVIPLDNGK